MSMATKTKLTRLWDYGWLNSDVVEFSPAPSDAALIEQYVASPAFHTSFVPNDADETGIHGPFVAIRISSADFVLLREDELERYLDSVELSDSAGEDAAERAKMLLLLSAAFEGGRRCYVLRRDERNSELFHEWGDVLFVFRELVFIGPLRNRIERFIIGYD